MRFSSRSPRLRCSKGKNFRPKGDSFSSPNLIFDFNKGGGETERGRASFEGSVLDIGCDDPEGGKGEGKGNPGGSRISIP